MAQIAEHQTEVQLDEQGRVDAQKAFQAITLRLAKAQEAESAAAAEEQALAAAAMRLQAAREGCLCCCVVEALPCAA